MDSELLTDEFASTCFMFLKVIEFLKYFSYFKGQRKRKPQDRRQTY